MKQYIKFLFILFFSCGFGSLYAKKQGQAAIDSLLKELPKQKEDTNKVNMLNSLSFGYSGINSDEGIKYGQLALTLAMRLDWKSGIADADNNLGNNYRYKSDFPKALEYFSSEEEIGDEEGKTDAEGNMGMVYYAQGDYQKALECYYQCLKKCEEIGNKDGIASMTNNIARVYQDQNDTSKALEYYNKALKKYEETGDKEGIAGVTLNTGMIYNQQQDYARALDCYSNAQKVYEELGDKNNLVVVAMNFAMTYEKQKSYVVAIEYLQQALKSSEEIGDKFLKAVILDNTGSYLLSLIENTTATPVAPVNASIPVIKNSTIPSGREARLQKAIDCLQQGLRISADINAPQITENIYEGLAEAYQLNKDYKQSLEYYKKYTIAKDTLFSKEKEKKIVTLMMKDEYARKSLADSLKTIDKEKITALKLERQRSYTYLGVAGIVLLLGFSFFIVKERRKSDNLLLNILPSEVAAELKSKGVTKARHYNDVTVMFTDFVNFTTAGERMSPQALIDELHTCFKAFDEITGKYHIEKIKTIGDAYLAVAGLPKADPAHAENTVRAAVEIEKFMSGRFASLGDKTFQIRIGIHSGSVVAGIVGVKKFAYDIWGDTVNTAARMEQNSETGRINISQTTYELVKDKFECMHRGEIDAKNKGKMNMYFVG